MRAFCAGRFALPIAMRSCPCVCARNAKREPMKPLAPVSSNLGEYDTSSPFGCSHPLRCQSQTLRVAACTYGLSAIACEARSLPRAAKSAWDVRVASAINTTPTHPPQFQEEAAPPLLDLRARSSDSVEPRAETWEKMGGDVCAIERAAARAAARTLAIAGRCDHAALLRRATAQPSKPSPSKPSVAGSGTDTAGGLASRGGM